MGMYKRIISLALVGAMLTAMLPPQAFATETEITEPPAPQFLATETLPAEVVFETEATEVTQALQETTVPTEPVEETEPVETTEAETVPETTEETTFVEITEEPANASAEGDFTYTVNTSAGTATVTGYTGSDTAVEIPAQLGGYPVTAIGASAFANSSITSLVLPEGLTAIYQRILENTPVTELVIPSTVTRMHTDYREGALWGSKVEKLTFAEGMTKIPYRAAHGATSLTDVTIPSTVTAIDADAFRGCTALTAIELPDTLTSIGEYCFAGSGLTALELPESVTALYQRILENTAVTELVIPASVTRMHTDYREGALFGSAVEKLTFAEGMTRIPYRAAHGATSLTDVTIPSTVTVIDAGAFDGCTALTAIELPDSLTTLGEYCFSGTGLTALELPEGLTEMYQRILQNTEGVKELVIPASVTRMVTDYREGALFASSVEKLTFAEGMTKIPYRAAQGATCLTDVTLPSTVTVIDSGAFQSCTALAEITLPDALETLGGSVFDSCTALTAIELPDGLTSIGEYCFSGAGLTALELPESVTALYQRILQNTEGVKELVIPASVTRMHTDNREGALFGSAVEKLTFAEGRTEIPFRAAHGATSLTDVTIPSTVTVIDAGAFDGCTALTAIELPDSLTTLGEYCFSGTGLTALELPEGLTEMYQRILQNTEGVKELVIPASVTRMVTDYREGALFASSVEKLTFAEGMTKIPYRAAQGATCLTDVTLPSTVTVIDGGAFQSCTALAEITLPDALETLGGSVFDSCTALTAIELPDGLTSIGEYCFSGAGLTALELPESVTALYQRILQNTEGVKELVIPASVTRMHTDYREGALFGSAVEKLTFAEGRTEIPFRAAHGATSLTDVTIPSTVTVIDAGAFDGCTALTAIELPDSLTTLGEYCFSGTGLTALELPEGLTEMYQRILQNTEGVKELVIPASVTRMVTDYREGALFASSVEKLTFSEGMTEIPYRAAQGATSLTEVTIPSTVTVIDTEAFNGCTALETLYLSDAVTSIYDNAFANCPNLILRCSMSSYALEYALKNDILVSIVDYTRPESEILDMDNSYYMTNSSVNSSSGYIDLVLRYTIEEDKFSQLSDMALKVLLPSTLVVLEASITLDGRSISGYTYEDNLLTIPVTAKSGTVRFSVVPSGNASLMSRATLRYTLDGSTKEDVIDFISSDMPLLTLKTGSTTNTAVFPVSGVAPAEAEVCFTIDGADAGSTTASKAGNYKTSLTIPTPEEGKTYTVTASVTVGDTVTEKSVQVTYDLSTPVLQELLMYYSGHDEAMRYYDRVVDMTDMSAGKTVITFNPNYEYTFRVKMSNPGMVSALYVTSTRNGVVKYIEANYDPVSGYFVTAEKFDGTNTSYVPGEIGIAYDLNYNHIDKTDENAVANALIDETIKNVDLSSIAMEVTESSDTGTNMRLTMPDGVEVTYEYHEFTKEELYDYLVEKGAVKAPAAAFARTAFDPWDLVEAYLKKQIVGTNELLTGKTDDGLVMVTGRTVTDEEVFRTWVIESAAEDVVNYTLDPDGFILGRIPDGPTVGGLAVDAGVATYKYFDKMWQLDMQAAGASEYERAQIEATRDLMTFIFVSRLALAVGKTALMVAFPGSAVVISVGSFLLENMLDTMEEEGNMVTGFENSVVASLLTGAFGSLKVLINYLLCWIIDPSGYVFEAVTDNRLSGVTVTVYYQDLDTGEPVLWDAESYDQINPILTYADGVYAWDVPEGLWQVKYEREGYETVYSDWMEVPPPQTDVNVGLVSYAAPTAAYINVYRTGIQLEFDKYMDPETVGNVVLTDSEGNAIDYTLNYSKSETDLEGNVYARVFDLDFVSKILKTGEVCRISIPETVKSYAGVGVSKTELEKPCTEEITISAPESISLAYGDQQTISVTVSAQDIEKLEVTSLFDALVQVVSVTKKSAGTWDITIKARMSGETAIRVAVPDTNVSLLIPVSVGKVNVVVTLPNDFNRDGVVNLSDGEALLWHVLFPDACTISGSGDVDGSGKVDEQDVVTFLWYLLFPSKFVL